MSLPLGGEQTVSGGGVRPRERSASTQAPAIREHLASSRKRYVAALVAVFFSGVACIATLIEPQWLELLFAASPGGGDGSLRTLVAVAVVARGLRALRIAGPARAAARSSHQGGHREGPCMSIRHAVGSFAWLVLIALIVLLGLPVG